MDDIIYNVDNWKPMKVQIVKARDNYCKCDGNQQQNSNNDRKKKKKQMKVYIPPCNGKYIDTHCHLHVLLEKKFEESKISDFPQIANKYFKGGFEGAITIACWPKQYQKTEELIYSKQNKNIFGSFGVHPRIADEWNNKIKQHIIDLVKNDKSNKIVAVGECGLDYSHPNNAPKDIQQKTFIEQIELSKELNLPLVVHSREASNDTVDIMRKYCPKMKKVHLHCFTDKLEFAQIMLKEFPNLKIGFTGCILFKKADDKRNTVKHIPLDKILLESDSPFFATAIHPGTIPKIAVKIAEIHGIKDVNEVFKQCRLNAREIYGI